MAEPPSPKIVGIDHVDVYVPELPTSLRYFREVLGAELLGASADHAFLLFGDQVVGLRPDPARSAKEGVHHLALRVDRFDGLREALVQRGATVKEEKTREESRSLFVDGPNGLSIELVHRPLPDRRPDHSS